MRAVPVAGLCGLAYDGGINNYAGAMVASKFLYLLYSPVKLATPSSKYLPRSSCDITFRER